MSHSILSNFKLAAKGMLESRLPAVLDSIRSVRFFRQCRRQFGELQADLQRSIYGTSPIAVLCGPFQGMKYFNRIVWGPLTPKWIGSYESELHQVVIEAINHGYDVIVDIGAAEGYYAVGLARACPQSSVISFDTDFIARRRQRELAALNGVAGQLTIGRLADAASLNAALAKGRCLVISDIEGAEVGLLDPSRSPNLRHADILVECHQTPTMTVDDVAHLLHERFDGTHDVEEICSRSRSPEEWQSRHEALRQLGRAQLALALDECRYPQKWLRMKSR